MNGIVKVMTLALVGVGLCVAPGLAQIDCGVTKCTGATVEFLKINNGRVWFVVENYAELGLLSPADCTVDSVFDEGQSKLAVYVAEADSERDLKVNFLTVAAVTGQTVDFQVVTDPNTGNGTNPVKCQVGFLKLNTP